MGSSFRGIFTEAEEGLLAQADDNEVKSAEKSPRGAMRGRLPSAIVQGMHITGRGAAMTHGGTMLQLLAPAGSTEAVIAAVQSGAGMIYIGSGLTAAGRGEDPMDGAALADALRYCRVRGCPAVVVMDELVTDEAMASAVERAAAAAELGAHALLVQDLGLAAVLRKVLPDMPLWGGVRLGVSSLAGALSAAALGLTRVALSPELSADQVAYIAQNAPIETMVCVHGPVWFAHGGQCYMSALGDDKLSDNCRRCAEPCRGRLSLGGRMDEYPMAIADVCLIDHLQELEGAGVACAVITGRGRRPEYVAYVTRLYARAIREQVLPTAEEREELAGYFAPTGLSDGYYTGAPGPDMFGVVREPDRAAERLYADVRKSYMNGELRRVPVKFYVILQQDKPAIFAAEDGHGHRAVYNSFEPTDLGRQGLTEGRVREIMHRTGGTPYNCTEVNCAIGQNLDYPDEAVDEARRELLSRITEQNRAVAPVRREEMPPMPEGAELTGRPKFILQVSRADQLTEELAGTGADLLYVPAEILAAGAPAVDAFRARGTQIAAVLPRVVTQAEEPVLRELLATLRDQGVDQVLAGNLGFLPAAREAGMGFRGDFGLNVVNSWALKFLSRAGFLSVTASFELEAKQIRALSKSLPTEMIIYGRMPVMVADHCLIRASAGRCACATPSSMADPFGSVYPVEKEFGCRNVVYDGKKIFLADRPELYAGGGLWGMRLLFTTENPRECVSVAERYRDRNTYEPTNVSRGAYLKGALWT